MEKIDLPIEIEENDKISPWKPDFKWLWKMILVSFSLVLILYVSIIIFSKFIIQNISIEEEKKFFWELTKDENAILFDKSWLWEDLWELNNYEIYISEEKSPNAFATIWANIYITEWLLKEAKTKEEILFILAHEMTHVKNRDVLTWFTKTMPFTALLNYFWIDFWSWILSSSTFISTYFTREIERKADFWAIEYINNMKLNWTCVNRFFSSFASDNERFLKFTTDHPINKDRIDYINENVIYKDKECEKFDYKEILNKKKKA